MIEVIEYYNQVIADWIRAYYADGAFLLLAIASFIYLYVNCKELRYKFLLPAFLMLFIAVNPVLYTYIFRRIIYWRLLWMLPTTVLIATAVVVLLKRLDKLWMKWGLLLVLTAFVVSQGEYMFSDGVFTPRSNWEKLSQETIDVCDIMLELDESPRAVVPAKLFAEVRQYAPEISMMYGRDAHWYIRDIDINSMNIFNTIENEEPNFMFVLSYAKEQLFNFLVMNDNKEIPTWALEIYGYEEIGRVAGCIIYYHRNL